MGARVTGGWKMKSSKSILPWLAAGLDDHRAVHTLARRRRLSSGGDGDTDGGPCDQAGEARDRDQVVDTGDFVLSRVRACP